MNNIDDIRAKLNSIMIGIDSVEREEIINEIIMELSHYLSHGITEEEAVRLYQSLEDYSSIDVCDFVGEAEELGLITSSREPIAEPENLVKAREHYYCLDGSSSTDDPQGALLLYKDELEADNARLRGKKLEGK